MKEEGTGRHILYSMFLWSINLSIWIILFFYPLWAWYWSLSFIIFLIVFFKLIQLPMMTEWELDSTSGYYYNESNGFYYDSSSGFYYSDAIGTDWFLGRWTLSFYLLHLRIRLYKYLLLTKLVVCNRQVGNTGRGTFFASILFELQTQETSFSKAIISLCKCRYKR